MNQTALLILFLLGTSLQQCTVDGCINCDGAADECQACDTESGYEVSGTTCCNTKEDSYPDGSGSCGTCASLLPSCPTSSCSYSNDNLLCNCLDSYFWDGSDCTSCPQFCRSCSSQSQCDECSVGFTLKEGACIRCIVGCTHCDSSDIGECLDCGHGFYSQEGKCHLCGEGCEQCEDGSSCQVCGVGQSLQDGTCNDCSEESCEGCSRGFYAQLDEDGNPTGNCRPCSSDLHCQQCRIAADICTKCQDGYEFLGITCVRSTGVVFDLKLNVTLSQFKDQVVEFKTAFMQALENEDYEGKINKLHLVELAEGSTHIDGRLEVTPQTALAVFRKIQGWTDEKDVFPGFPVLSLENVQSVGWTYTGPIDRPPLYQESFPWYGILLVVLIPILLIIFIVWLYKHRTPEDQIATSQQPIKSSSRIIRSTNLGVSSGIQNLGVSNEKM